MTAAGPGTGELFFDIDPLMGRYEDSDNVVTSFYLPLLSRAVRYDRVSGYFTSGSLGLLARGLSAFIHRPDATMRLIVGGQLADSDVAAIEQGADLVAQVNARILDSDFWDDLSDANDLRRGLLAWLLANGRLEMKVGLVAHHGKPVPQTETTRYFHHKFGIFEDSAGNRVAFDGSNNETVHGLGDHGNGESFSVFRSWRAEGWQDNGEPIVAQFDKFWQAEGPVGGKWFIVPIDDAVRQKLLQLAPPAPPDAAWLDDFSDDNGDDGENGPGPVVPPPDDDERGPVDDRDLAALLLLRDAPKTARFTAALSATAAPFPHQSATVERSVSTFPRSYLFGDEVGLGKTIELGLTLRELLLSETIERALILPPAGVIAQWQDELADLINLDVPRWGNGQWIHPDGTTSPSAPGDPWSTDKPVVLVSSHLARRSEHLDRLCAQTWDVVIVDEAHHARRREGKETGSPNNLLRLLRAMRDAGSYRALYLASATPMQMHPHEAWDLIDLFGLPEGWSGSPEPFTKYFTHIGADWTSRTLPYVASLVQSHFTDPDAAEHPAVNDLIAARAKELPANHRALLTRAGKVDLRKKYTPVGGSKSPLNQIKATFADDLGTQALVGAWLQANNPMRDRVFRNTRQTLRAYRDQGLWPVEATIPTRHPEDVIERMTPNEEDLYCRVQQYILTKYHQAEQLGGKEQNALGFILTVYRRRLTSSFHAIAESLRRRVEALQDEDLATGRLVDEDDTLEESGADVAEIDAAIKAAATDDELLTLQQLVEDLAEHAAGDESKMFWLRDSLDTAFKTGHTSALIFTQYADTMHYIRDRLNTTYSGRVIGYSSAGGNIWDPTAKQWLELTKDEVKDRFRSDEPHILVGTDTLAEGLNLQTCGWMVNWDMPWNFTRVEQRIGRVDRIGGHEHVYITNFFYDQTVEAKVYKKLRDTIGGFDAIVGVSQPVLEDLAGVVAGAVGLDDICDHGTQAIPVQQSLDLLPDGPALDASVADVINAAQEAAAAALAQLDDDPATATQLGSTAGWTEAVPLGELEQALTASPLTAHRFSPGSVPGSYELRIGDHTTLVTFDRGVAREHAPRIELLTWGTRRLDMLFATLPKWTVTTMSYRELLGMPEVTQAPGMS